MSVRVITMNGELKYQGDVGPRGPAGPKGEQGAQGIRGIQGEKGVQGKDGISPTVEINKIDSTTTIAITDQNGTKTAEIKDGEVTEQQLENAIIEAKSYTDNEIATFDFIKVVNALPQVGLPNKIYLVPKADVQTQDLFDEYVWVNNSWEWITTKQVEVDLSNYATKNELNSKVDKIQGKSLSTNDYTSAEKNKLAEIETGAEVNKVNSVNGKTGIITLKASDVGALPDTTVIPNEYKLPVATVDTLGGVKVGNGLSINNGVLNITSEVENVEWDNIQNKPSTYTPAKHTHTASEITDFPTVPTKTSELKNDSNFVTDTQMNNAINTAILGALGGDY